ncbi:MAG: GGDEF domain-containing protein, partial [Candidatus Fimadaptatus sp.]
MKKAAWYAAGLLLSAAVVWFTGLPELPTADPTLDTVAYDVSVRAFLGDNMFALSFFIASMLCGSLLVFYSAYARLVRELSGSVSNAAGVLGAFVILTGVWVLTDSRFFLAFRDAAGDGSFVKCVTLVSYASILLLPVAYAEFLKCFVKGRRYISVLESVMNANLLLFLVLLALSAPSYAFLGVLSIQHVLIVVLGVLSVRLYSRDLIHSQNIREHNIGMGTTAFGVISVAALVAFLLGQNRAYPVIYGIGLLVLIFFMVRLLFAEVVEVHKKQMQAEFYKKMAYMDALTGLQNRNAYIRDRNVTLDTAHLGVVIMDVNSIKAVNDTRGHECGDMLIRAAADVIQSAFGSLGTAYRIGGDEFAVICPSVDEAAIRRAIAASEALQAEYNTRNKLHLSIAVGYAVGGRPGTGPGFSGLVAR